MEGDRSVREDAGDEDALPREDSAHLSDPCPIRRRQE
jgi:hypothetical protein